MNVDVQVRGAGLAGRLIATALRDAGVEVRLVDPRPRPPPPVTCTVLGVHPEHPWRFEAALGSARAAELSRFLQGGLGFGADVERCGVEWVGPEAEEHDRSVAAAARMGLRATRTARGFVMHDAGRAAWPALDMPVWDTPVDAELEVLTTGGSASDPWLDDTITPVRWQGALAPSLTLPRPEVRRQATTFADSGWVWGARWATPHLEVGEREARPEPRVHMALERVARQDHDVAVAGGFAWIVGESCDGLPIVGPLPGRARVVVCGGFGFAGMSWAPACARAVVDGLLGRAADPIPAALRARRFA